MIGATTRAGMLSNPLRARFGITGHMEYYAHADLTEIVERTADIFEMEITHEAASELALRSRGTPRIANRLLKRVRDFAQIIGNGVIDDLITDKALTMLDVDHEGLDYVDQKILRTMIEMYGGGPVGLGTLSVNIAEERETVEDMYEPYLIKKVLSCGHGLDGWRLLRHMSIWGMSTMKNEQEILEAFRKNPDMMAILTIIRNLGLKDSWLAAGSVRNFIWNLLSDKSPFDHETDVDVIFFDPDISYEEPCP